MKVAVVMGSKSDYPKLEEGIKLLEKYGIEVVARALSAHRTPEQLSIFLKEIEDDTDVIIAAAGKAAHLPGVIASQTLIPVIGLPIKSSTMDGLDSLLSIVQMPKGIPVATVTIDLGLNAALLALQIMTLKYPKLKEDLKSYREEMAQKEYVVYYKDDATAFNGEKKAEISSKGILNNKISTIIFEMLKENNINTHFIKSLSDREMLVKKVEILPLEVIVRNIAAGSICKRVGLEEGVVFDEPIFEISYKNDAYAVAMKLATREELKFLREETLKINELLKAFFLKLNLKLVDFKIEFGKDSEGNIILADEVSPDTCRLWDVNTNEKLDKDRFRKDLGDLVEGYTEVLSRMNNK